jgi:hypothetical protein
MSLEIREVSGAEREAVYRLRYEIYIEQCGYRFPADHANRQVYQPELDDQATILGAFVDGRLVGTSRVVWGGNQEFTDDLRVPFGLDAYLRVVDPDRIQIAMVVAILQAHAGAVATPLFLENARIGVARGVLVSLLVCQPHHVRLYERLGALSSGHPLTYPMGVMFPFAFLLDASHYRDLRSPFRAIVGQGAVAPDTVAALRALFPVPPPVLTMTNAPDLFRQRVSEGLSRIAEAGLRDVATVQELQPVLDDSILFDLPAGMLLTGKDMRQQTVYLVLDGTLEIVDDGEIIGTCEAGGYVGEVAFLLDRRRMSDVRGGPQGARLLAFGTRALSRRTDAAGPFWRSVAADVCAKLVATAERRI